MNNEPRQTLIEIVRKQGTSIVGDSYQVEALLRDACPQNTIEINLLVTAVKDQAPAELLAASATPSALLIGRLATRLIDYHALTDEEARWAVETWALALGRISESDCKASMAPLSPPSATELPGAIPHTQKPQPGATMVNPKDGAQMVYVPAGEFTMGAGKYFTDAPKHILNLSGYWIYKAPVTVTQYRAFCQATSHAMPPAPAWGWRGDHPVVFVTWVDAMEYAQWAGVSLPTEAQWEKAARGTDARTYPWGNEWDGSRCANVAWSTSGMPATQPVGSYPQGASPYGALDMAGNVLQWCADWYDRNYYKTAPSNDPTGPSSGTVRVLRGSSWSNDIPDNFHTAYRDWDVPTDGFNYVGFRCSSPNSRLGEVL